MGVTVDVTFKSLNKYSEILCGDTVECLKTEDSDVIIPGKLCYLIKYLMFDAQNCRVIRYHGLSSLLIIRYRNFLSHTFDCFF